MRFMLIARPQFPIPPDQVPALVAGFRQWWGRHRQHWEAAGFWAGENGGGGIANVPDEATFHRMMVEWPFTPFSHLEARALVDVDAALDTWDEALRAMAGPPG